MAGSPELHEWAASLFKSNCRCISLKGGGDGVANARYDNRVSLRATPGAKQSPSRVGEMASLRSP
jgi:hypothetical protein